MSRYNVEHANKLASEEYQRKVEIYNSEMQKLTKLYPCTLCGSPKYVLSEDGLKKVCETECEHFKIYIERVAEYQVLLLHNLRLDFLNETEG